MKEKKQLPKVKDVKEFVKKYKNYIIGGVICIIITIWLCNFLFGDAVHPIQWSETIQSENVKRANLSFWNVEGYPNGLIVTMTDEMTEEFIEILNNVPKSDFKLGALDEYDTVLSIECSSIEYVLLYKEGAVGIIFSGEDNEYFGNMDWKICNDELSGFFEKYREYYVEQLQY